MNQNHRRQFRKAPDDPTFIQIERDEVGRVLNVSEGGLSFCSVTPVPRNLPVYFWFSFNLKDRIEGMGEVAWTDLSRKIGGLKFTQLSKNGREQIRQWLSRSRPEEVLDEEPVSQRVLAGKPNGNGGNGLDRVARFVAKARTYPASFLRGSATENPGFPTASPPKAEPSKARVSRSIFSLDLKVVPPSGPGIESSRVPADRPIFSWEQAASTDFKVAPPPPVPEIAPAKAPILRPAPSLEAADPPNPKVASPPPLRIDPPKFPVDRPIFSLEGGAAGDSRDSGSSKLSSLPIRGLESLVELVPLQRHLSAKKRQLVCGVFLGVCISAGVAVLALKYGNYRAHAENMQPNPAETPVSKMDPPSQPAAPTPQTKSSYPVQGIFSSTPARNNGTPPDFLARGPVADAYRKEHAKTVSAKPTKAVRETPAQPQRGGIAPSNKRSATPTQLWTAVQAGDSKAAVELAELYIKGQGVPQNCQQARVLLLVASEKRDTAAITRLHELDKDKATCP